MSWLLPVVMLPERFRLLPAETLMTLLGVPERFKVPVSVVLPELINTVPALLRHKGLLRVVMFCNSSTAVAVLRAMAVELLPMTDVLVSISRPSETVRPLRPLLLPGKVNVPVPDFVK